MDISFKTEAGKLNYRITAVIYNQENGKFLVQKGNAFDFWVLPGGRCQMGETSEQAVIRELQEELGLLNLKSIKAVAVSENLFNFEDFYHELSFCYLVELDKASEILQQQDKFYGPESQDYIFQWLSLEEIAKIDLKPEFSFKILKNINQGDVELKHYVLNEL